ncbi:MAG: histidinol-phosphate transaminase [Pseudomonadales bacterium]|jgi:histidinol-phosphate aminotransferase
MTRTYNPALAGISPYRPGKPVAELTRELGITDVVKLASNENPRGPGPVVRAAIVDACDALSRYPDGNGFALKSALAERLGVDIASLTLGNGSNDVLDLMARVALAPGASAIISAHAFIVYKLAVTLAGGTLISVPARNYGADLDAMLAAIRPDTAIVFIANPNNPTGTWISEVELTRFLDAVPGHVWVVLDEAYFEYVEAPGYPDGVRLLARYPNLVVTRTFSKIHGLAALRVGYAVSSPEAAELLGRVRQPFNVNSLGLAAAAAALADDAFVSESRRLNREGLAELTAGLARLGLPYIPSAGNFVAFEPGRNPPAVYDALLREGVIVRPIGEYGLDRHLRVTVGLPEETARFLRAIERVLG